MRLPGFLAEVSLRRTSESFASAFSSSGCEANGSVTPAGPRIPPGPIPIWLECFLTGGLWTGVCCQRCHLINAGFAGPIPICTCV